MSICLGLNVLITKEATCHYGHIIMMDALRKIKFAMHITNGLYENSKLMKYVFRYWNDGEVQFAGDCWLS